MALTLPTKKVVTLDAAKLVVAACEKHARDNGWKVVIAVVDDGGHAILLQRLDGAR